MVSPKLGLMVYLYHSVVFDGSHTCTPSRSRNGPPPKKGTLDCTPGKLLLTGLYSVQSTFCPTNFVSLIFPRLIPSPAASVLLLEFLLCLARPLLVSSQTSQGHKTPFAANFTPSASPLVFLLYFWLLSEKLRSDLLVEGFLELSFPFVLPAHIAAVLLLGHLPKFSPSVDKFDGLFSTLIFCLHCRIHFKTFSRGPPAVPGTEPLDCPIHKDIVRCSDGGLPYLQVRISTITYPTVESFRVALSRPLCPAVQLVQSRSDDLLLHIHQEAISAFDDLYHSLTKECWNIWDHRATLVSG